MAAAHASSPPATASPWDRHARQWHLIGPPLRPSAQDLAPVQRALDRHAAADAPCTVLLLGVTAELAALRFPRHAALLAVDASMGMLQLQWQAPRGCAAWRVQAQWEQLPLRDATVDLVLADGSLCALPGLPAMEQVVARAADSMRPGARLIARMFTRPHPRENLADVLEDIRGRRVGSVHVAKWRVAMALHGDLAQGVVLDDVWRAFMQLAPDTAQLARLTGWPLESVGTLQAYQGVSGRYFFPTHEETGRLFSAHLQLQAQYTPSYELGERCPTWELRKR